MRALRVLVLASALAIWHGGIACAVEPDGFFGETEIRDLVSGTTFEGEFRDGIKWREAYHTDGSLDYDAHNAHWVGDWHADGELFCTFYRGVIEGGCYLVRQMSANCYYFYVGGVGIDQPKMSRGIEDRQNWYARGWRNNAVSTCPDQAVS